MNGLKLPVVVRILIVHTYDPYVSSWQSFYASLIEKIVSNKFHHEDYPLFLAAYLAVLPTFSNVCSMCNIRLGLSRHNLELYNTNSNSQQRDTYTKNYM